MAMHQQMPTHSQRVDALSASVLVVDDEDSFVDALAIGLTREGFVVRVARDGAEALEQFDASNPDAVLLDVLLPKVSGLEVCRRLRSRSSVPIIMVSARDSDADRKVGLAAGANDYVTKPYRFQDLIDRLQAALADH
jgi:two-component system response regulator RegX3